MILSSFISKSTRTPRPHHFALQNLSLVTASTNANIGLTIRTMAGNKSKADGMRPNKGSAKSTSGVQSAGASATEPSRFLFKTATAPNAETAPASTPRNPFVLPSVAPANGPKSSFTTTTTEKKTHKPLSKEEYLAQAERRYQASRDRADAELRKLYQTTCPFAKRAVKRYAQRRSQWAESRKRLQKAGAFLENTMGTLSNAHTLKNSRPSASASKHLQKTSPQVSPEPSSAKPHALPQISFSVDDHRNNDSSKAPSVTSSSDETVKSDTRTVDSLSTNITTPDLSDCDSLVKSVTKSTKQKTTSSSAAVTPSQTKADIVTEKPTPKAEKFKITINVEAVASSKESKSSTQKTKEDAGPTTTSGALTPKKSVDQKHEKKQKSSSDKQDGQELQKEKEKKLKADAQPASEMKKSKKHKRDEDDQSEGATEQPKAKKSKTSAEPPTCSGAAMTPAAIDKSYKPYPNVPPEIRKELFVIKVQEMLDNPLGYDDLVYDDNRPKSKRPKWRKTGRNTGHNDMMMSGGIGPADPSSGSHKSGKGGANKKNRSGGDDSLSKQVLKKGHNKRVAEEVASLKKSSVAAESGSSFGEKREKEFKKNKHGHQNGQGQKNWKHKPNQSGSLAAKFRKHK